MTDDSKANQDISSGKNLSPEDNLNAENSPESSEITGQAVNQEEENTGTSENIMQGTEEPVQNAEEYDNTQTEYPAGELSENADISISDNTDYGADTVINENSSDENNFNDNIGENAGDFNNINTDTNDINEDNFNNVSDINSDTEDFNNIPPEALNQEEFSEFQGAQQESSFEDEIDFDANFDINDIEKLQARIQNNMSSEFAQLAEDDEEDNENSVVKKYNIYISKDFVPILDNLSTNELSAYINDAIQKKIDTEDEIYKQEQKQRVFSHLILTIITACLMTPALLFAAHKSITATLDNYKYSQDNFEKLYRQRLKKDKVYTRSLKYSNLNQQNKAK